MAEENPNPKVHKVDLSQPVIVETGRVCYLLQAIKQPPAPTQFVTVLFVDGTHGGSGSYSTDMGGDGYLVDVPIACTLEMLEQLWQDYWGGQPPGGDGPGTVVGKPPK